MQFMVRWQLNYVLFFLEGDSSPVPCLNIHHVPTRCGVKNKAFYFLFGKILNMPEMMPATDWIHVPLFGEVVPSCRPYMALELMHTPELAKTLANRRPVPAAHLPPLEPVAPNGQALIKHPL